VKCLLTELGLLGEDGQLDQLAAAIFFGENFPTALRNKIVEGADPCFKLAAQFNNNEYYCRSYAAFTQCVGTLVIQNMVPYVIGCFGSPFIAAGLNVAFGFLTSVTPMGRRMMEEPGKIIEVGESVKNLKVGDRVFIQQNIGGLAEENVAEESQCFPIPAKLTYAESASLFIGFMTAYHGLVQRGQLKSGEFLLVTGAAGGMGDSAVQLGKVLGAKVIACASSDEKIEYLKQIGADYVINYQKEDMKKRVEEITNGKYADVIYEMVGGDIFEKSIRCIAGQGRLLVIGFAGGKIPTIPANLVLIKGFSVVGVRAGYSMRAQPRLAMELFVAMKELIESGKFKPRVGTVIKAGEDIALPFRLIFERKALGKLVVQWRTEETQAKL